MLTNIRLRWAWAAAFAVAIGGCVDELDDESSRLVEVITDADLEVDDQCGDFVGRPSCLAAGCLWQPIVGAMLDAEDACTYGEPHGLCFDESYAQPCGPEARRCDDGRFAWVLPGPDNAVLLAYSESSCSLPYHFMPCPTPTMPDDLTAEVDTVATDAPDLDTVAMTACSCACDEP